MATAETISQAKRDQLTKRMAELGIKEEDLVEKYVRGSGSGGQKQNKSSTCVYLKHTPTGEEVKCQKSRSRENNRFFARRLLCEQLDKQMNGKKSQAQKRIEKAKKAKAKRKSRSKAKYQAPNESE